jgi:hypothetical protein
MIPTTVEDLREYLRDWPAGVLQKAIRAALPDLRMGTEAWIAYWLIGFVTDPRPPLEPDQVAAIWQTVRQAQ